MKTKQLLFITFLFGLLTITGCSQPKIVIKDEIAIGSMGNNASITLEDIRPQTDKEYSMGSVLLFKDDYGIWTLGDDMFSPTALELLKKHINHTTSKWKRQPVEINIKLKRLKFEANHQASMLAEGSSQLGPLGVVIAESMAGKKFELDFDKNKPFVLGFIEADVSMRFSNGQVRKKSLSSYKAENFSHHMNVEGRMQAAARTLNSLYSSFSRAL